MTLETVAAFRAFEIRLFARPDVVNLDRLKPIRLIPDPDDCVGGGSDIQGRSRSLGRDIRIDASLVNSMDQFVSGW